MPYIDENDKPAWLAYNETTGLVEPVRVDPIFGYVQIFAVADDSSTPTAINTAKIDGNDNPTVLAYNDVTGLPEALRCGSNGELKIVGV